MTIGHAIIALLLVIGGCFGFVGSLGLVKLRTPMMRLHAPTKASTLGVGALLLAAMVHSLVVMEDPMLREVLITIFLFVTAPVTALYIARVHLSRSKDDLPGGWPSRANAVPEDEATR